MKEIIEFCDGTENRHFKWFGRLIANHLDGIKSFAKHRITSGRCEGIVQLIKTIRRSSYGLPDTKYLFHKIMDGSRRYRKTPASLPDL